MPFQRIQDEPPAPEPEPAWKTQLGQQLAAYRERQGLSGVRPAAAGGPEDETLPIASAQPATRVYLPTAAAPAPAPSRTIGQPAGRLPPLPPPVSRRGEDLDEPVARPGAGRAALPLPPVVDAREPRAEARRSRGESRPRMEDVMAPLSKRLTAGALDLALTALGLGAFLIVVYASQPGVLAEENPNRWWLVGGIFVGLLCFYWLLFIRYVGATPGMLWTRLRLLNFDCRPPDATACRVRAAGTLLSALAIGVGFLWALVDEQKLTWHDRLSRTFVAEDRS